MKHLESPLGGETFESINWKREYASLTMTLLATQRELELEKSAAKEFANKYHEVISILLALKAEQKKEREAFVEEMQNGFKDLQRVEKERDQYKRLWELRGRALARPCAECGYAQEEIKPQ